MKTGVILLLSGSLLLSLLRVSAQSAPSGLIDQWSAEGNANDSIGSNNGFTTNIAYVAGHTGTAFGFDGTGFVDAGQTAAIFETNDFTISFWIQTTSGDSKTVLDRGSACVGDNYFESALNGGHIEFTVSEGANNNCFVTSVATINDGAFHHVALVRQSTDLGIYIDGILNASSSSLSPLNLQATNTGSDTNGDPVITTPHLLFGAGPCDFVDEGGTAFVGALDEIQIYNRALDDTEIYGIVHPDIKLAILTQPLNQRTLVGRSVVFHVGAVGWNPMRYQWRLNGLDIPGAISNNLAIPFPLTTDAGTYTVLVNNQTGSLTSQPATLFVTNLSTPSDSLVARWSGEGSFADSFGGHTGLAHNTTFKPGVLGTAFSFNGNGAVDCGNVLGAFGTNDFTIDFWMNTKYTGYTETILGQGMDTQRDPMCGFGLLNRTRAAGTYSYVLFGAGWQLGGAYSIDLPIHVNDGVFHHVAGVRRGASVSLYIDGKFAQTSYSPWVADLTPASWWFNDPGSDTWKYNGFKIGAGAENVSDPTQGVVSYRGAIDEVEVHNRALTDSEIYSDYSPDPTLVVITPPKNTTVVAGSNALFSVSVTGVPPYSYQWRFNGSDIPGATNSAYAIEGTQLTDAGTYSVAVNNAIQSTFSEPAKLTVVDPATILPGLVTRLSGEGNANDLVGDTKFMNQDSPQYSAGVIGEAFNFGTDAVVTYAHDYMMLCNYSANFGSNDFTSAFWVKTGDDGFNNVFTKGSYAVFTGNGGHVTFAVSDDAGYNYQFSNSTGPSVTDGQFHHVAVTRTNSTTFQIYIDGTLCGETNVPVLGSIPPTYRLDLAWSFNLPPGAGWSGRLNGSLDELEFYNRALSGDEIASLYGHAANTPRIDGTLKSLNSVIGDTVTLGLNSVSGPGPFTYQWMRNGVEIAGATGATLTLTVDGNSAGNYSVVVSNAYGSSATPIASLALMLSPGTYNGLFYLDEDPTDDSSGFVRLTVNRSQTYTGSIRQHGSTYSFTGSFAGGQSVPPAIHRRGKTPLRINFRTPQNSRSNVITGVVNDGLRVIPLQTQRVIYNKANPTPQAGKFTLALTGIDSVTAPNGHGFGNVTITPNGLISLGAKLADNTTVSQGTSQGISVANAGTWPIYLNAYNGKGSVLGWLSFSNTPGTRCAGTLRWVKSSTAGGKNYTQGFATKIPVLGSSFVPATSGLGIDLANASLSFDGANIYTPVNELIVTNNNLNSVTFQQSATSTATLKVIPGIGQVSGTFIHPVTHQPASINAVVLQDQSTAAGYFISGGLSGRVAIKHN